MLALLDRLAESATSVFFMQNIWLVMITMSPARGPALNFLSRRLPQFQTDDGELPHVGHTPQPFAEVLSDVTQVVGRDIGLMIRAFAAVLEDDNLLVRRGALDILLQSMRIDSAVIKSATAEDRVILMKAATGVVLRRDLSLNRRLYTWLLGPDDKSEAQSVYLRQHGLQLLSDTLKVCPSVGRLLHFMPTPLISKRCCRPLKNTPTPVLSRSLFRFLTSGKSDVP